MVRSSPLQLLSAAILILLMVGCARPPELIGVDNPQYPAASLELDRQKVFIATTRQATEVTGAFFTAQRAPELGLASVEVTIPPGHVPGKIERARQLPPDPRREFSIVDPTVYGSDGAFIAALNKALAEKPPGQRSVMFFVHGYNTSASDGILRLAQFVQDSKFEGVPVLFTWASAARTPRYVYDLNSALVARAKLKEITEILTRTNAEGFGIFAHSMGTFLTMEGMVDAQLAGRLKSHDKLEHIVLAAPDIDIDLFRTQVGMLPVSVREKLYVLVSKDDFALRISRRIAGGVPRVGAADTAALERLGVTVIDLSKIHDQSSSNHTKFAGSPQVVQIIGQGLNANTQFSKSPSPALGQLLAASPIQVFGN
ncbi:esterase/lipase superfamily enzyme [Primorskyibacter sedentarius]|uniref:Esterase/lipase superfamily enzyme n=1 Tax=Primorskyibacter sedentarius TaxID=745311 RepID=A0A4R3J6D8_9RHOB|nr:alpha/beta hydrolase [Primorskyibacter sedentarius]TCS61459.1 esterase/lipase superfamily enzyme [Primorskyibacter sedentarius]